MPAYSWPRAWLRSGFVALLLAGGACSDDDLPEVTSFGETLFDTTGDPTAGVGTFDPDSTGGVATMGGDATQGETQSPTTDAPTTDAPTTDAPTTGDPTTSEGGPVCGNGLAEPGEPCDGEDLGGEDCTTQGFLGGALGCNADCTFDTTSCTDRACGNGTIEGAEACDGAELGGATCQSEGFDGGVLACAGDCSLDTSACTIVTCGNGALDAGEACDGANLGGQTCVSQGFAGGGVLGCAAGCAAFDTAGCLAGPMCGNGAIEAPEVCDGASLGGQTCVSQGFAGGGVLACAAGCNAFDTAGCLAGPMCGNGAIEAGEVCDGANLGGQSCVSQGFAGGGVLGCAAGCGAFNTAGCLAGPDCGDGVIETPEVCDGANLGGQSCVSQGFAGGGILVCSLDCGSFNTTGCNMGGGPVCGNGAIEFPEVCDGANLGGQTCVSLGFGGGGVLSCNAGCGSFDTAGCIPGGGPVCGDGVVAAPEVCDGANLNGQSCVSQGFAGGGVLACNAGCGSFNTAGCIPGGGVDCCTAHGGVGCGNAACQNAICAADPFCCSTQWDDLCANAADVSPSCVGAGGTCPAGPVCGNGAVEAPEVCDGANLNGQTCVSQGFAGGGVLACAAGCNAFNTAGCVAGGADCCSAHGGVGCQNAACQNAICAADPFCCSTQWDNICANAADVSPSCVGAGGTCPAGGCAHPLCQTGVALANGCHPCVTQVCAADPFCCSTQWDGICVGEVTSVCGLACPGV